MPKSPKMGVEDPKCSIQKVRKGGQRGGMLDAILARKDPFQAEVRSGRGPKRPFGGVLDGIPRGLPANGLDFRAEPAP